MRLRDLLYLLLLSSSAFAATPQYSPRQDIATGLKNLSYISVADFNGDGKPDFAVTSTLDKSVLVYLNPGNGLFAAAPISTTLQITNTAGALASGDFNEDGKQDLIVATVAGSQADIFLSGNGDGTFTQQAALPASFGFLSSAVVDLNHDSHLDLVTGANGSLYVYLGDGHGSFTLQPTPAGAPGDAFLAATQADFNRDSNPDFVVAGSPSNALYFFAGDGRGSFAAASTLRTALATLVGSLVSSDFNGDGNPDLFLGGEYLDYIIFGNGDGTFKLDTSSLVSPPTPVYTGTAIPGTPDIVAAADMDGDGKPDAVVVDPLTNTINVDINDGSGRFSKLTPDFSAAVDPGITHIALGDLNGDGLPDILLVDLRTGNVSIFLSIKPKTIPTSVFTSSASQQLVGTPLTLTAKITATSGPVPTGSVTFLDGTTSLGKQTLDTTGQASLSISNLSAATHSLSTNYSGDTNYLPLTSTLTQAVTDFSLTLPTPTQAVTRGTSANYALTITPIAGLAGNVTLTCSGLPALSSCVANTVALTGQPATATLVVTTTAATSAQVRVRSTGVATAVLAFLSLLATALVPNRRALLRVSLTLAVVFGLGTLSGCGGSGSSTPTNPGSPGSPSGSTNFTITATVTQGTQTVSHTTSATLTVN